MSSVTPGSRGSNQLSVVFEQFEGWLAGHVLRTTVDPPRVTLSAQNGF